MNTNSLSYNTLSPSTIGFDRLFEKLVMSISHDQTQSSYPPYNIVKSGEDQYIIELAVAGFKDEELDISFKENTLTIVGQPKKEERDYIHKGIAARAFSRVFTLADTVEVAGASLNSGMLYVYLENIIPEAKKSRKILIGTVTRSDTEPQLLKE
jgi:molecular chaperone IbpA